MEKRLVLAEKPSVARDIARVLHCNRKENGYFEGDEYVVTWALGHLVTLSTPESYDMKYKSWVLEDLPILPFELSLEVIQESSRQYSIVKGLMYRKDLHEIIIATDSGREGELVARWIIDKANVHKSLKRLWISSVTDKAIQEGFRNLKPGRDYENLYLSAKSRAEADWYVGINATRALTTKYNAQLSCGRVQTPTLAIIAKREDEIKTFRPQPYYGLQANTDSIRFSWVDGKTHDTKTFDESVINQALIACKNKPLQIKELNESHKKVYSPNLYDLTELQRDANRLFNFSAKETLSLMQSLYEHHKILTYPRTDSRYISTDIVETLKDRVLAVKVGPYQTFASFVLSRPIKGNTSFVDNSKVSDHHAIIPTEERVNLMNLNDRERKIYDLVVKRFLSVLYPPYEFDQMTIKAQIGQVNFVAKGKKVTSLGFKELYTKADLVEDEEDDQNLPNIHVNDQLNVRELKMTTGATKPPLPFTEGTLLTAMENPRKYMESTNQELVKTLDETGGLGTVATRADIIEKLFHIFAIEKKGNYLYPTPKGKQLLSLVPEELKSPELTALWEVKLGRIAKGVLNKDQFIDEMKAYTIQIVGQIKHSETKYKHENISSQKCPNCGQFMLEVNGKDQKMLVCSDRSCGFRKVLSKVTNARCPKCHKKLEMYGEGDNQVFICSCGHKEKLSTFTERRKDEKNNLSKRDVENYMHRLNKESEGSLNNSLAEALKGLNLKK